MNRKDLYNLRFIFERIENFDLKMNTLKCAFGVPSKKFLRCIEHHQRIEIDTNKIKVNMEMLLSKFFSPASFLAMTGRIHMAIYVKFIKQISAIRKFDKE